MSPRGEINWSFKVFNIDDGMHCMRFWRNQEDAASRFEGILSVLPFYSDSVKQIVERRRYLFMMY